MQKTHSIFIDWIEETSYNPILKRDNYTTGHWGWLKLQITPCVTKSP
jgi:hypothetical protein